MTASTDIDVFNKGNTIEFSVSGLLTDTLMAVLMPNVFTQAFATNVLDINGTATARKQFEHGASITTAKETLTFVFTGVGGSGYNDVVAIPGCVCTSMTISGDPNEDGGRMKFDASYMSRTPVSTTWLDGTSNTLTALSDDYVFLGDYSDHCKLAGDDVILKSFAMTIENPVTFSGFGGNGTDGAPQQYLRSVPGMNVTVNPVFKYDGNLDPLWAKSRTMADVGTFQLADNATYTSGNRAIRVEASTIQSIGWDEGDYLGLSLELKAAGDDASSVYIKHA
jgi:hypothetical protein